MEYEILAPAGTYECAEAAINAGADAIYLGLNSFSARANAGNFDEGNLKNILQKAHFFGVKVYVAMNTLVKSSELEGFLRALLHAWSLGVDAIIMQDVFLGKAVHEAYPDIVLHLSTQAGVCNEYGAKIAKECGFSRVILARETPLCEIEKITKIIETEAFVQGALCSCFSGQCYFSSFAGGNSGNRGKCKQPCRKLYTYDRAGYDEKGYALSLSDLCVGEDIGKLKNAGVVSFKIEGRMRRAEYVSASVRYYRGLLDENRSDQTALRDLKVTYNRGNYTKGLTFSQDKRFLSRAVQGHLGENVGVVKVENGNYYVESGASVGVGDAFKILRKGKEVGGAFFVKNAKRGFQISSKVRLLAGDSVFLTTSVSTNERLLSQQKRRKVSLSLRFCEGERAIAKAEGVQYESNWIAEKAQSRPLTVEEIKSVFEKTDRLPIDVTFDKVEVQGDIFLPKSLLNAFRREFYEKYFQTFADKERTEYPYKALPRKAFVLPKTEKISAIAQDFTCLINQKLDIAIYKPFDYAQKPNEAFLQGGFEKYVYFPAFADSEDMLAIANMIKEYSLDGIYAENYGGVEFAREHGCKLFVGVGFNLTNEVALSKLLEIPFLEYYVLSKELDEREQTALLQENGFVLSSGNLKLMDLCYCPFEKSCNRCDKKDVYALTDENGREFSVRRYKSAKGDCRFEVYNCADLIGEGVGGGRLVDCSLMTMRGAMVAVRVSDDEMAQKYHYEHYTTGHSRKSVL